MDYKAKNEVAVLDWHSCINSRLYYGYMERAWESWGISACIAHIDLASWSIRLSDDGLTAIGMRDCHKTSVRSVLWWTASWESIEIVQKVNFNSSQVGLCWWKRKDERFQYRKGICRQRNRQEVLAIEMNGISCRRLVDHCYSIIQTTVTNLTSYNGILGSIDQCLTDLQGA